MEVGQVNKVGYIIQARMKSSRLPGKVLQILPIGGKRSILEWIIDEVSKLSGEIVVATSIDKSNDKIEEFCVEKRVQCFRGDENDVLSRFVDIQLKNNYDHIVRLTADNPFIDAKTIEDVLCFHIKNKFDYTHSYNLPLGMNVEIIKGDSLLKSSKYAIKQMEKEHVTVVLSNHKSFKKGEYFFDTKPIQNLRVTIDTVEDFLVANAIASFSEKKEIIGKELIEEMYMKFPFILNVNNSIYQKTIFSSVEQELDEAYLLLEKNDFVESLKVIKKYRNEIS